MDTENILTKLKAADEIPINSLESQSATLTSETDAYHFISSSLTNLKTKLTALNDPSLYKSKTAASSTSTVATATVDDTSAVSGSYTVNITQVATNSALQSGTSTNGKITAVPSGSTTISSISGMSVSNKTFTINGATITLTGSETLDDGNSTSTSSVIGKINNSSAGVTATYDSSTGKFSLTSNTNSTIVLGSGADTSNFLTQAQLFNTGSTTVTSTVGVGRLSSTATLSSAGLSTTPTAGNFTINGVSVTYSSTDTLTSLISKINASSAGVVATYDNYTDRLTLTSSSRGAQSITVADGTSNIGTALRLTSSDSTSTIGKTTLFTVGSDSTVRTSNDDSLTEAETGIKGLTITALATGSTTLNVTPDTDKIATAINDFVSQYNSTQNLISSYTKIDTSSSSTSSDVTAGLLAGASTVSFLPSDLRSVFNVVVSTNSSVKMLSDLGIDTNSSDNTVTSVDSTKLKNALTNHLQDVVDLFTTYGKGIVSKLGDKIDSYNSSLNGSITLREQNITQQQKTLADQIKQMQARVDSEIERMRSAFATMESAYNQSSSTLTSLQNLKTSSN
jgi:flagellar hook-associated protein 2